MDMLRTLKHPRKVSMNKKELEEENKLLKEQLEKYHQAYDNIIIIQESILKGIKQIKAEKRKITVQEDSKQLHMLEGYLKCLYKMSGWIDMQQGNKDL